MSKIESPMSFQPIIVAAAILLTGIMAGIFFTWSNAVMPGIGKLDDLEFLQAFKSMNRVILNRAFLAVFGGAMLAVFLVPVSHFMLFPKPLFWFYLCVFFVYAIGVFGVTVNGNIPLNELLDQANLSNMSGNELKALRETIESKWISYNLIRTLCSTIAFACLIYSHFFWGE